MCALFSGHISFARERTRAKRSRTQPVQEELTWKSYVAPKTRLLLVAEDSESRGSLLCRCVGLRASAARRKTAAMSTSSGSFGRRMWPIGRYAIDRHASVSCPPWVIYALCIGPTAPQGAAARGPHRPGAHQRLAQHHRHGAQWRCALLQSLSLSRSTSDGLTALDDQQIAMARSPFWS